MHTEQVWLCRDLALQDRKYLYFPSCKIVNADRIHIGRVIFYMRSHLNTPLHYPAHNLLKGKAEFIFTDSHLGDVYEVLNNVKPLKKKNISLVAFFDPGADIVLKCVGVGKENQICSYIPIENGQEIARSSYLDYMLNNDNKVQKIIKI